jgi:hypothetical protein
MVGQGSRSRQVGFCTVCKWSAHSGLGDRPVAGSRRYVRLCRRPCLDDLANGLRIIWTISGKKWIAALVASLAETSLIEKHNHLHPLNSLGCVGSTDLKAAHVRTDHLVVERLRLRRAGGGRRGRPYLQGQRRTVHIHGVPTGRKRFAPNRPAFFGAESQAPRSDNRMAPLDLTSFLVWCAEKDALSEPRLAYHLNEA